MGSIKNPANSIVTDILVALFNNSNTNLAKKLGFGTDSLQQYCYYNNKNNNKGQNNSVNALKLSNIASEIAIDSLIISNISEIGHSNAFVSNNDLINLVCSDLNVWRREINNSRILNYSQSVPIEKTSLFGADSHGMFANSVSNLVLNNIDINGIESYFGISNGMSLFYSNAFKTNVSNSIDSVNIEFSGKISIHNIKSATLELDTSQQQESCAIELIETRKTSLIDLNIISNNAMFDISCIESGAIESRCNNRLENNLYKVKSCQTSSNNSINNNKYKASVINTNQSRRKLMERSEEKIDTMSDEPEAEGIIIEPEPIGHSAKEKANSEKERLKIMSHNLIHIWQHYKTVILPTIIAMFMIVTVILCIYCCYCKCCKCCPCCCDVDSKNWTQFAMNNKNYNNLDAVDIAAANYSEKEVLIGDKYFKTRTFDMNRYNANTANATNNNNNNLKIAGYNSMGAFDYDKDYKNGELNGLFGFGTKRENTIDFDENAVLIEKNSIISNSSNNKYNSAAFQHYKKYFQVKKNKNCLYNNNNDAKNGIVDILVPKQPNNVAKMVAIRCKNAHFTDSSEDEMTSNNNNNNNNNILNKRWLGLKNNAENNIATTQTETETESDTAFATSQTQTETECETGSETESESEAQTLSVICSHSNDTTNAMTCTCNECSDDCDGCNCTQMEICDEN